MAVLVFLAATGPILAGRISCLFLEIVGLVVGLWAVLSIRLRQLRISPDIAPGAEFITRGPYRYIRHPMYLAVLLVALALILDRFTWSRGIAWIILLADLIAKLSYEERLLCARFPDYLDYRKRTKRLLPFVY